MLWVIWIWGEIEAGAVADELDSAAKREAAGALRTIIERAELARPGQ